MVPFAMRLLNVLSLLPDCGLCMFVCGFSDVWHNAFRSSVLYACVTVIRFE